MKTALKLTALFAIGTALISLAGCAAGIAEGFSGNKKDDINAAIQTLNVRFGTEFRLKSKKLSGGAACNFTATCAETGDKEIYIFQSDKDKAVQTDYIYVRYGAEALSAIRRAAETACPGCKVIVNERVYNHLPNRDYDKNTDLAGYLAENTFQIDVYVPELPGTAEELITEYDRLADIMKSNGIGWNDLYLGCCENFGSVVVPDHIICTDEPDNKNQDGTEFSYSEYCATGINRDVIDYSDYPGVTDSPYHITINGEYVK